MRFEELNHEDREICLGLQHRGDDRLRQTASWIIEEFLLRSYFCDLILVLEGFEITPDHRTNRVAFSIPGFELDGAIVFDRMDNE